VIRTLSILSLAAVCAAAASASPSPSGRIVFLSASGTGGKTQAWIVNANGAARRALSPANVSLTGAALSRDGSRVAFVRHDDIYVMRADGSHVRRLTYSAALEGAPAWSPDGRWIAYSSYRSGHSSILKMRASDGGQKTVLAGPGTVDVPAWSPDGRRIAYAGVRGQIWLMNADGSGKHALTKTRIGTGVDWAPAWSPDGRRIAYESNVATGPVSPTNEIWVIGADGSRPTRLTHNHLNDNHPVWSPDGTWLAFSSPLPRPGLAHLWLVRPTGTGLHRLTSWAGEQYSPSWAR
jgi:TolB protein